MYWKFQEEIAFKIVLFVVFVVQVASVVEVWTAQHSAVLYALALLGANILLFWAMIKYAKWVWTYIHTRDAVRLIVKYEAVIVVTIVGLVLIAKFIKG